MYLSDLNGTEKSYFLNELEQDSIVARIFLPDISKGSDRNSIALKTWFGAISAAKSTRVTFSAPGGEQSYDTNKRKSGFKEADKHADKDKLIRAGIEVVPILELIIKEDKE